MTMKHQYKPTALKLPYLTVFLSLFVLSIGLIERLLKTSSGEEQATVTSTPAKYLARRATTLWCDQPVTYTSQLSNLESQYNELCATFSSTFAPASTSLSPPLQTSFSQWAQDLRSLQDSQESVSSISNVCRPTPFTTPVVGTFAITAGCTSIFTSRWNYECPPYGQVVLDGSSLATSWSTFVVCGAAPNSQMIIATRTPSNIPSRTGIYSAEDAAITSSPITTGPRSASASEVSDPTITVTAIPSNSDIVITHISGASDFSKTTSSSASPTPFHLSSDEVMETTIFTPASYFAALFLASLIAVIIKVFYESILAALKMVEPFHQIRQNQGAASKHSVLAQYLRSSLSLDALRATSTGQLLPLWSVIMFVLVGVIPSLASAAMSVHTRDICNINGVDLRCDPVWVTDLRLIRFVEVLLAICAGLVVVLVASTWRYTLNISSNPSCIASIATMLNYEPLLDDLLRTDPDADEQAFEACLENHRFWLEDHQSSRIGHHRHGIVARLQENDNGNGPNRRGYSPVTSAQKPLPQLPLFLRQRHLQTFILDIACLFTIMALFGILLAYFLDYSSSVFNEFFSSQKSLPKFILVGIATLADIQFKNLERVIRVTEPYRRLSLGQARPETTILLPLNGTSWSNLPRCIYSLLCYSDSHMLWQTFVSTVACLGDLNIVTIAGVLYTDSQTHKSFVICSYVSIIITGLMILVTVATMTWWRQVAVVKSMPRRPETIAAVMSYLCGSVMIRQWATTVRGGRLEDLNEQQRNRAIIASGRKYRFRRELSVIDERLRWCIDFEEDGFEENGKLQPLGYGQTQKVAHVQVSAT